MSLNNRDNTPFQIIWEFFIEEFCHCPCGTYFVLDSLRIVSRDWDPIWQHIPVCPLMTPVAGHQLAIKFFVA
jgi:hypothetical protein